MIPDFWQQRWQENNIGFHLEQVNPVLQKVLSNVLSKQSQEYSRCLVPLCGKSHDLVYLAKHFKHVVGIELSEIAILDFFKEQSLDYSISDEDNYKIYTSNNIKLYQGDFFEISKELKQDYDLIYDRAALVAMPKELRQAYVDTFKNFYLNNNTQILLIALSYNQSEMQGPPFSVAFDEINMLYGDKFSITIISKTDVLAQAPRFKEMGLNKLEETTYIIQLN